MAKRRTNRKVVIRYRNREPQDPKRLLEAVEEVLRPQSVEVVVEDDAEHDGRLMDEPLETTVRAEVSCALEAQDRELREAELSANQQAERKKLRELPAKQFEQQAEITPESRYLRRRVTRLLSKGWNVVAKVLPLAKQVKDLFS